MLWIRDLINLLASISPFSPQIADLRFAACDVLLVGRLVSEILVWPSQVDLFCSRGSRNGTGSFDREMECILQHRRAHCEDNAVFSLTLSRLV